MNRVLGSVLLLATLAVVGGIALLGRSGVADRGEATAAASGIAGPAAAPGGLPTQVSPPATAIPSSRVVRPGRLVFGTFDPSLDDFVAFSSRVDGTDLRMLLPGPHECPNWSPDGTEITVTSIGLGGTTGYPSANVFATIVKADGTIKRHLALADRTLMLGCTAWSPDGRRVLAEGWDETTPGREGLYFVNSRDGGGLQRVTTSTGGLHDIPGSMSPDGKRIVYVHVTNDVEESGELWIVDVDGSHPRKVGDGKVGFGTAFSPDGRSILAEWGGRLLVYDVSDLNATPRSIKVPGLLAWGGSWSPDGRTLLFSAVERAGQKAELYTMNVDGTDLWQVTSTAQADEFGDWALPPD
jgi:hypothetical protein